LAISSKTVSRLFLVGCFLAAFIFGAIFSRKSFISHTYTPDRRKSFISHT
jgi:hypothetical protein